MALCKINLLVHIEHSLQNLKKISVETRPSLQEGCIYSLTWSVYLGKWILRRLLYPPNAYTMPWIRTDKIYTLIDHVLPLLLPTSYMST